MPQLHSLIDDRGDPGEDSVACRLSGVAFALVMEALIPAAMTCRREGRLAPAPLSAEGATFIPSGAVFGYPGLRILKASRTAQIYTSAPQPALSNLQLRSTALTPPA